MGFLSECVKDKIEAQQQQFNQKKNQNDRIQMNACVASNTSVCCCEHLVWRSISSKEKPFQYLILPRP